MQLDRIELADINEPVRLAKAVHRQLYAVQSPVPVVEIAQALDIEDVAFGSFDGFEGMLLTDRVRSKGGILANNSKGVHRARFTVAHELGHFLMERHELSGDTGFTCQAKDLRETRQGRLHQKQETQANRFAIELLAPAGLVENTFSSDPDLKDAQKLRDQLDISLEACVRRLVELRPEPLAAIWSFEGRIRYVVRGTRFPFVTGKPKEQIPKTTQAARAIANGSRGFTEFADTHALSWTSYPDLQLYEQTRVTSNGHAVTLLWADLPDDDEADEAGGRNELTEPRFR